jgi:hypothetical protein
MRLGGLGCIDTQVDKGRGCVRNCAHIKANGASVGREDLADIRANFPNTQCIHSPLKKDAESPILDFVSEGWALTAVHQVIHSCEGKDTLNIRRAVGNPEKPVASLEFPGGFKD